LLKSKIGKRKMHEAAGNQRFITHRIAHLRAELANPTLQLSPAIENKRAKLATYL
jgi:hypothetical protein